MDTLRGPFDTGIPADENDWDAGADAPEEEAVRELPPEAIGQDERRMQVRAYNHWASLLGDATFPSIEDLEPHNLTDFGPNSVLLDFSSGIEDPVVQYLGDRLGDECGAEGPIRRLSDVPPRSLLSRITDHYMQILANQAPIGFEAEFVNQRGSSILYRGILLPFSSDDETIDFIYGVINWKEMADAATADELLLEIDQALEAEQQSEVEDEDQPHKHHADALTEWADSPAHEDAENSVPAGEFVIDEPSNDEEPLELDNVASLSGIGGADDAHDDIPMPDFGQYNLDEPEYDEFGDEIDDEDEDGGAGYSFASLADYIEAPAKKAVDLDADQFDPDDYRVEDMTPGVSGEDAPIEPFASLVNEVADEAEDEVEVEDVVEAEIETVEAEDENGADQGAKAEAVIDDSPDETVAQEPVVEETVAETEEPLELTAQVVETLEQQDDEPEIPVAELPQGAGIHDCLASARELAQSARVSEDRSRHALYAAVGRAYDFSIAASEEPEEYNELIEDSGLTVQDRAPMTPIVKLVFGHDYDKTRLTEYAAVLSHAHRLEIERGRLADYLASADGGLKGVVNAERRLRREESGKEVEAEGDVRAQLAKKLRELEAMMLDSISGEGPEFSLVMVRRDGAGNVAMIGEIDDDIALIERAGKKLVG